MKKLLVLAAIVLGFAANSFAQGASATASASGNIISPITISKSIDLSFGDLAVNALPGTIVLTPAGGRTASGGVSLPAITGSVTAAEFTVSGTSGYLYTFSVPVIPTTVSNGIDNMTINNFTSNSTGTLTGGTETVNVGATLNVGGSISTGLYTSTTPFQVTVNYN